MVLRMKNFNILGFTEGSDFYGLSTNNIIGKIDFRHEFSFSNGFTQPSSRPPPLPPHLLNGHNQNPLSMAKVFVGAPSGGGERGHEKPI